MAKFPDFIIIGAMKCGTTVLWRNMNNHPNIFMGKNWEDPKKTSTEIRFWNNGGPHHTWKKKGLSWYRSLFIDGQWCGEKSANYIESYDAFKRMSEHCPWIDLILCVRNPVDRFYSEYQMQRDTAPNKHPKGFSSALKDKGYHKRGCYYQMLKNNVLPFFPKDQISIVIQERMYADTTGELNKLYRNFGLDEISMDVQEIKFKERDKFLESYRRWETGYSPMSDSEREYLFNLYKDENSRFFDYLGFEIKEWQI